MFRQPKSRLSTYSGHESYARSVLRLIGHLIGTAVIFVSLFAIGWTVSFVLHYLHGIFPFPTEIFDFITKFELYLVYGDSLLCAFVLLGGAVRFIKDGWENRK